MGAREGERTRLDRAQSAALTIIDELPANSTVQILTAGSKTTAVGPRNPSNLDQARELIKKLAPSSESTDFLPAMKEAALALDRTVGGNKEIYLFSDMGRNGFDRQASALKAEAASLKERSALVFVRCTEKPLRNLSLRAVTPQIGLPSPGVRIPLSVLVANTGTEVSGKATITLEVDGRADDRDAAVVEGLAPGESRSVTLTAKFPEAGRRVLTAKLVGDELAGDDRLDSIIWVRERVRVLVIDGTPSGDKPETSGSFFLGHALAPVAEGQRDTFPIRPRIIPPEQASAGELADPELVVLAGVAAESLTAEFRERLRDYVREGRGLLISGGPMVDPAKYNELFGKDGLDLLPGQLGPIDSTKKDPVQPSPTSIEGESFLSDFRTNDSLRKIGQDCDITGYLPLELADGARALMRYTDGGTFVASKRLGDGEVFLVTTSLDKSLGFFAIHPTFPAFIQTLVNHLIQAPTARYNSTAGDPLTFTVDRNDVDYELILPDGLTKVTLGKPKVQSTTGRPTLTYADTSRAGVYQLLGKGDTTSDRFAVQYDPREADEMAPLDRTGIDDFLGFKAIHLDAEGAGSDESAGYRARREWTVWVFGILFAFLLAESLWAWRIGRPS